MVGGYEVSDRGDIRRVTTGQTLRPFRKRRGREYLRVDMSFHGVRRRVSVHVVVAEAFHGPRPSELHQVNHIDGVPSNNRADNLEWVTGAENIAHAVENGLTARGERHARAKLTEADILDIRNRRKDASLSELADAFGVTRATIANICAGRSWSHVGGPVTGDADERLRVSASRVVRGERQHHSKLTEDDVRDIRRARRSGEALQSIAGRYPVVWTTVQKICNGKAWTHVRDDDRQWFRPDMDARETFEKWPHACWSVVVGDPDTYPNQRDCDRCGHLNAEH